MHSFIDKVFWGGNMNTLFYNLAHFCRNILFLQIFQAVAGCPSSSKVKITESSLSKSTALEKTSMEKTSTVSTIIQNDCCKYLKMPFSST